MTEPTIKAWLRNVTEDDAYAVPWTFGEKCKEAAHTLDALQAERDALRARVAELEALMENIWSVAVGNKPEGDCSDHEARVWIEVEARRVLRESPNAALKGADHD